jgi:hypothetical protein
MYQYVQCPVQLPAASALYGPLCLALTGLGLQRPHQPQHKSNGIDWRGVRDSCWSSLGPTATGRTDGLGSLCHAGSADWLLSVYLQSLTQLSGSSTCSLPTTTIVKLPTTKGPQQSLRAMKRGRPGPGPCCHACDDAARAEPALSSPASIQHVQ